MFRAAGTAFSHCDAGVIDAVPLASIIVSVMDGGLAEGCLGERPAWETVWTASGRARAMVRAVSFGEEEGGRGAS